MAKDVRTVVEELLEKPEATAEKQDPRVADEVIRQTKLKSVDDGEDVHWRNSDHEKASDTYQNTAGITNTFCLWVTMISPIVVLDCFSI